MAISALEAVNTIWGAGTAESILEISATGGANSAAAAAELSIGAMKKDVNRIRGYKVLLTPADNDRLTKVREQIQTIDKKAADGTVRADELDDRAELFKEADRILGKPSADVEFDDFLDEINGKIEDLLLPRLDRNQANRLETLEMLRDSLEEQIEENPNARTPQVQLQNVARQINELTPARQLSELSFAERAEYDALAELANDYAGAKIVLNAKESDRVFNLEKAINDLSVLLPPDPASQPSASAVARAYSRLA